VFIYIPLLHTESFPGLFDLDLLSSKNHAIHKDIVMKMLTEPSAYSCAQPRGEVTLIPITGNSCILLCKSVKYPCNDLHNTKKGRKHLIVGFACTG
jgi:hypothetical protein